MEDLVNIYLFLLQEAEIAGPINCTSPNPVRNRQLTHAIGEVLRKPTFMPSVPAFAMKMILGDFGSILVKGQKVLPKRLLDKGFHFRFPEIKGALQDILG
jgi:NAD dependent epimerase/dehydratase family enzyme